MKSFLLLNLYNYRKFQGGIELKGQVKMPKARRARRGCVLSRREPTPDFGTPEWFAQERLRLFQVAKVRKVKSVQEVLSRLKCAICQQTKSRRTTTAKPLICQEFCVNKQYYCSQKCKDKDNPKRHPCTVLGKSEQGFAMVTEPVSSASYPHDAALAKVPKLMILPGAVKYTQRNNRSLPAYGLSCIVCRGILNKVNGIKPTTEVNTENPSELILETEDQDSKCSKCHWPICGACHRSPEHKLECAILVRLMRGAGEDSFVPVDPQSPDPWYLMFALVKVTQLEKYDKEKYETFMNLDTSYPFKTNEDDRLFTTSLRKWKKYFDMLNITRDQAVLIFKRILLYRVEITGLGLGSEGMEYAVLPIRLSYQCQPNITMNFNYGEDYIPLNYLQPIDKGGLLAVNLERVTNWIGFCAAENPLSIRSVITGWMDGSTIHCPCDVCRNYKKPNDTRKSLYSEVCKQCSSCMEPIYSANNFYFKCLNLKCKNTVRLANRDNDRLNTINSLQDPPDNFDELLYAVLKSAEQVRKSTDPGFLKVFLNHRNAALAVQLAYVLNLQNSLKAVEATTMIKLIERRNEDMLKYCPQNKREIERNEFAKSLIWFLIHREHKEIGSQAFAKDYKSKKEELLSRMHAVMKTEPRDTMDLFQNKVSLVTQQIERAMKLFLK